jgi:hypothetical protein
MLLVLQYYFRDDLQQCAHICFINLEITRMLNFLMKLQTHFYKQDSNLI